MKAFIKDGLVISLSICAAIVLILGIVLYEIPYVLLLCILVSLSLLVGLAIHIRKKIKIEAQLKNGTYVVGKLVPELVKTKLVGRNSIEVEAQVSCFDEERGTIELFTGKTIISGFMSLEIVEKIKEIEEVKVVYLKENHSIYHVFLEEEVEKIND